MFDTLTQKEKEKCIHLVIIIQCVLIIAYLAYAAFINTKPTLGTGMFFVMFSSLFFWVIYRNIKHIKNLNKDETL